MKMKKTDIGVVAVMYAVCAFFYYQTVSLDKDSQTYPTFTIILLFALTTMYLIQMIINAKKYGVESGKEDFKEFKPAQFFVCLGLTVLYLVMIHFIGFYISTTIFMVATLLYLRVPLLHSGIALAAILLLIFLAFSKFLGVKLPVGELIKSLR